MRGVEALPAQHGPDLTRLASPVGLLQDAQLIFGREAPPLRLLRNFGVRRAHNDLMMHAPDRSRQLDCHRLVVSFPALLLPNSGRGIVSPHIGREGGATLLMVTCSLLGGLRRLEYTHGSEEVPLLY